MTPGPISEKVDNLRGVLNKFNPGWYKIGLALIAVITVAYAVNFINEVRHAQELGAQVSAMRAQQAQINERNAQLRKAIKFYHNPAFAYAKAREWGYVKAGDRPVIVSVHYLKPKPHLVVKPKPVPTAPPWQQWWNAFFG